MIKGHHGTEDKVVFDLLAQYVPEAPYDKLRADHHEMTLYLDQLDGSSELWRSGDYDAFNGMTEALESIYSIWFPHIKIEETILYIPSLLERLVPESEEVRVITAGQKYFMENAGPDYLVIPYMLFDLEPDKRAMLAAALPPVVTRELVPIKWKELWAPMKPFLLDTSIQDS